MKSHTTIFLIFKILLFSFCIFTKASGQNTNEQYQTQSIYLRGSNKYVKNGVTHRLGLFGKNLKNEMVVSKNAVIEFNKFQQKRKTGVIMYSAGFALVCSGLLVNNESIKSALFIGGLGLCVISLPISSNSEKNLQKAIWIRNGDILY